jgi:hypothetical protein
MHGLFVIPILPTLYPSPLDGYRSPQFELNLSVRAINLRDSIHTHYTHLKSDRSIYIISKESSENFSYHTACIAKKSDGHHRHQIAKIMTNTIGTIINQERFFK